MGTPLLSPGSWCAQGFVCALQECVSPVLCKFWQLYCGVNGNLLQKGLCHIQVYCTQSPCSCGRPLLTCTSTGDTQIQFWLSLCGVSGSWCAQGFLEPSKRLWRVQVLILNVISPLLPSCWGFFFALGCGVSLFGGIQHSPVMVVQQRVLILEFSQEKMSTRPSIPSSSSSVHLHRIVNDPLKNSSQILCLES